MARKHEALDVMKMFATLQDDKWLAILRRAVKSGNINKLIAYRYGLQAGLTDAASKGLNTKDIDIWAMKKIKQVEQCAKFLHRKWHPNPLDTPGKAIKDRTGYVAKALESKRRRDRAFEDFLLRSNF